LIGSNEYKQTNAFERSQLENRMNKKQTYALKMKLSTLGIRLMDAKRDSKPTQELQSKFDALLTKLNQG
jgi:hypothetical protein